MRYRNILIASLWLLMSAMAPGPSTVSAERMASDPASVSAVLPATDGGVLGPYAPETIEGQDIVVPADTTMILLGGHYKLASLSVGDGNLILQDDTEIELLWDLYHTEPPSGPVLRVHGTSSYLPEGRITCDTQDGQNGEDGDYGGSEQKVPVRGGDGTDGQDGQNGCSLTLIVHGDALFTQYGRIDVSGTRGGDGGSGGNGSDGLNTWITGEDHDGYPGGDGGNGGRGGRGGNGGQLHLSVYGELAADSDTHQVLVATGGRGGDGGNAGHAGRGGYAWYHHDGGDPGEPGLPAEGGDGGDAGTITVWATNIPRIRIVADGGAAGDSGRGGNGSDAAYGGDRPYCGLTTPGSHATDGAKATAVAGVGGTIAITTTGWLTGSVAAYGGGGAGAGTPGTQGLNNVWRFGCTPQPDTPYPGFDGSDGNLGGAGGRIDVRCCYLGATLGARGGTGGRGADGGGALQDGEAGDGGDGGVGGEGGIINRAIFTHTLTSQVSADGGAGGEAGEGGKNSYVAGHENWGEPGQVGVAGSPGATVDAWLTLADCSVIQMPHTAYLPAIIARP